MTPEEAATQARMIAAAIASRRSETRYYEGEPYTLREVERRCEVYRYSHDHGEISCRSTLRFVQRRCEVYFSGRSSAQGEIDCRGSELNAIERYCTALVDPDSDYGVIEC